MMNSSRSSMGALPAHFVDAMRVLFDIMDTDRTGYIRFDDLARKWKHLPPAAPNVPPGFLNCLHKVTPPNGMLTFERFCAGLRLALAENRSRVDVATVNGHAPLQRVASEGHLVGEHSHRDSRRAPPPTTNGQPSSLEKKKVPMGMAAKLENRRSMQAFGSTPTVNRPSVSSNDQWSQPAMGRNGAHSQQAIDNYENIDVIMREKKNKLPSRWTNGQAKHATHSPTIIPPAYALYQQHQQQQQQQHQQHQQQHQQQQQQKGRQPVPPPPPPMPTLERLADGSHPPRVDAHQTQQQRSFRPISAISTGSGASTNSSGAPHSHSVGEGSVRWRDRSKMTNVSDGRRHTMSEENAPKVAKHERLLDEENELVRRGLDTCSKLVNWYNERMTSLEKRSEFLGKGMVALESAVHEERLNYLRAHVTEVNRRMVALMETSERGFPTHINLEVRNQLPQPNDDQLIWLHRQNRQLTEEISEKTKLIEHQERELKALLKQLHEPRNGHMSSTSSVISQNLHRPSALVRPALHQPNTPTYATTNGLNHISAHKPVPVKVHATLM